MDLHKRCEMAIEIIKATEDGDLLSPQELFLTQEALNNNLNDLGMQEFRELHKAIKDDTFIPFNKRWFHGIEHMTADTAEAGGGLWINWKGHNVEHYDQPWAWSKEGKEEALEVAERCKHLESIGIPTNTTTVIWDWEKYEKRSTGLAIIAMEAHVACLRQAWDIIHAKLVEENGSSHNKGRKIDTQQAKESIMPADYEYCPHCHGSFSFAKLGDNFICKWCKKDVRTSN